MLILLLILGVYSLINLIRFIRINELSIFAKILEIIAYAFLIILAIFEIYWIAYSFKRGTTILNSLCFNKDKTRNNGIFIISLIFSILFLSGTIIFLLPIFNIYSLTNLDITDYQLLVNIMSFLFANNLFVFIYALTMKNNDFALLKS